MQAKSKLLITLVLALMGLHGTSHAKVNTEKLRSHPKREGFSGRLDGTMALKSGNVNYLKYGGGVHLSYLTSDRHHIFAESNLNFGKQAGETYINNMFAHLRWTAMWHDWFGTELFHQLQNNEFTKELLRVLAGIGLRIELMREGPIKIALGSGYMLEHESLDLEAGSIHPAETLNHRWTNYLTVKLDLWERVHINNTLYLQPRLDAFTDYRMLEDLSFEIDMNKNFKFVLSLVISHDSVPADFVEPTDISLTNKIRFSF